MSEEWDTESVNGTIQYLETVVEESEGREYEVDGQEFSNTDVDARDILRMLRGEY